MLRLQADNDANFEKGRKIGPFGLQECNGLGLGFTCVSRELCETIAAKAPRVRDGLNDREMASVFRVDTINGTRRTEDMAFFQDIRDAGYTVWMDPTIELGHIGERRWVGRLMDAFSGPIEDKR